MRIIAVLLVAVVALSHLGFLVLEMFYWNHQIGRQIFETTPEFAAASAVLAANQGLYNGFLAAGLIWGLVSGRRDVKVFFLCCVIAAGVYGGLTAKMSILYIQGAPALAALIAVLAARPPPMRARSSPMPAECLKPCPEQGEATMMRLKSGWWSMMKRAPSTQV